MALIKLGTMPGLQHGSTIRERDDGVLEGSAPFMLDIANVAALPVLGSDHPFDPRLKAVNKTTTFTTAEKVSAAVQYMGITQSPTPKIIHFPQSAGSDDIIRHPAFSDFAGVAPDSVNGSAWTEVKKDDGTSYTPKQYQFVGFTDPANRKYGTNTYIVPNSIVTQTWWENEVPTLGLQGEIVNDLPGVEKPPPVVNWLRLASTYRQITQVPLYQVEETFQGSDALGFDEDFYSTEQ